MHAHGATRRSIGAAVLLVLALLLLATVVPAFVAPVPATAATKIKVVINGAFQSRAGYTGDGGLFTPSYSVLPCGTEENENVRVRDFTVVVSRGTKKVKTSHEPMDLLRLKPGSYEVKTTLRYTHRGTTTTKRKTQTVKITRKTDATSVSDGEYRKIKDGMTLAQVRKVVGGKGRYEYSTLWIDALKFEHSVAVSFEKGRVTDKWRNRNVYDWC